MTSIVYPSTLPCPAVATIKSVERRLLSPEGKGPRLERTVQRDRLAIQQIVFPPMSPEDSAIFDAWWRDDLILGGAWFAATWPLPQGLITAVRRFIGAPNWQFISAKPGGDAGGRWQISATCEVRGRGVLPGLHQCLTGPSWSQTVIPSRRAQSMAYLNGYFVSAALTLSGATSGDVLYTSNGVNWLASNVLPIGNTFSPMQVEYGNGIWVANTDSSVATAQSSDLVDWTLGTGNPNVVKSTQLGMWFGNGLFVICAGITSQVFSSADASGQTTHTTPANFNTGIWSAGNSLHYACRTSNGAIYTSPDLDNWTLLSTPYPAISQIKRLVTNGGGHFIAIDGLTQRDHVKFSSDYGATWSSSTGLPALAAFYVDALYLASQGLWMLTDDNALVYLSMDNGASWVQAVSDLNPFLGGSQNWWMAAEPAGFLYAAVPVTASVGTVAAVGVC